ncbi:hypothetical protein O7635_21675 [Asanoa sp. WMMD1127]|uniref:hypothetical protein n=1 Tax=Asanoa sp. WMMD1127 TaxID=3016107 RepID=UPI002417E566|nr:hypothetical protein [Asanoa sp. WMMD1127]MDG4824469.1 hypothetical protein [Asanoa sp. WMMD1127]
MWRQAAGYALVALALLLAYAAVGVVVFDDPFGEALLSGSGIAIAVLGPLLLMRWADPFGKRRRRRTDHDPASER